MIRKLMFNIIAISIGILIIWGRASATTAPVVTPDYNRLLGFIQEDDLTDPLMVFGGMEENFDRQLNRENIAYLNGNRELLQKIQTHLKSGHIKWQLSNSFNQLWIVPENRSEYAQLFEHYCQEAVAYLLARLRMKSPYDAIATLTGPLPAPKQPGGSGLVTAYLVHNIADEYIEEYLFFDADTDGTKIRIKLSNRAFDGKIGSYTSRIKIGPDNQYEFIRDRYTLWQNSASNPLNVFIVPIEETLHILLRSSTEQAIYEALVQLQPENLQQVTGVIDHWMAVEEAVVGGLVWQIMPELLEQLIDGDDDFPLAQALAQRDEHAQYRFLDQGIDLVRRIGVDETVALYQDSAKRFKAAMIEKPPNVGSAAQPRVPMPVN